MTLDPDGFGEEGTLYDHGERKEDRRENRAGDR